MAYAHRIKRLTFSGTCFGGAEVWSTGLWIASPTADVGTATQTEVDLYAARWRTFFQLVANKFHSAYVTTQTKLAVLDTAGVPDPLNTVYNTLLVTGGTYGGEPQVPQASLVASLRNTSIHGIATHGRMYLPGVTLSIDPSTAKISTLDMGNIATNFQALINGINTDAPVGEKVCLVSKGTTGTPVGVSALVTHVEIGNAYDTQRRRRNGLTETYTNKTIP
jgi:hypothetical protein